jgi:hypothetical protein
MKSILAFILVFLFVAEAARADGVVHVVPATIDATGKIEVSTALMKWLVQLPAATKARPATVRFASGGTYWVDYTIILRKNAGGGSIPGVMWNEFPPFSLDHFRFDLNGATIEQRTKIPHKMGGKVLDERKRWGNPIIAMQGATDVQIFGGTLRGSCPAAEYKPVFEEWTGIRISGNAKSGRVEDIVVRNLTIENVFGDYIYIGSATTSGDELANVRIENNTMRVAGRQGIVLNGGVNVLIKGNTFGPTARFLFDSEPTASQGWAGVTIDGNRGTSGKLGFLQFHGPKRVVAERLTITNNELTGGHFKIRLGNADTDHLRVGFTFANNTAIEGKHPFGGEKKPATLIEVSRWRDVVIRGNREYFEPVNGRPFHNAVRLHQCEGAKVQDNVWKNAVDGSVR